MTPLVSGAVALAEATVISSCGKCVKYQASIVAVCVYMADLL
jgi:hypothetical protein